MKHIVKYAVRISVTFGVGVMVAAICYALGASDFVCGMWCGISMGIFAFLKST